MPAPVHATTNPAPKPQPAHVTPASKYSIDAYLVEPSDVKPKATVTFSAELRELMEELESHPGCELVLASAVPRFNTTPSGIFTVDLTLGGGWADNFESMVYGYGNSGKTTTILKAIAGIQRKRPQHRCVLCDVETTFDPTWAEYHGVDLTRLQILRPSSAEEGADIMLGLTKCPDIAAIVLDSIPVFTPSKDFDDSLSDAVMATRARLMGRFSTNLLQSKAIERQKKSDLNPYGHDFMWFSVNSWRSKIGLVFGDPRTLPGGDWQHTFHRTKIEMRSKEQSEILKAENEEETPEDKAKKKKAKKGASVSHTEHEFTVAKAKIPGVRNGEFRMIMEPSHRLGLGAVDDAGPVGAWAKRLGVIRQSGSDLVSDVFDYRISGREALENLIETDTEFGDWLRLACMVKQRVALGMPPLPPDGYLVTPSVAPGRRKKPAPVALPLAPRAPGGQLLFTRG